MAWRTVEVIFRARDQQLRSVLTTSGLQVETWARKVQGAGNSASRTGIHMQQALATGAVVVAGAFVYGAAKAIAFEKAMRNVNSLSHLSEARLKALSQQVLGLSKTLPTSAQDLAEGLYQIASSGFQGAQGLTILKASAQAASAGMSTTSTSAKAIVAVLNAYGLSAGQAADVSDVLFQTVNYGVLSFDELASNLGDFIGAGAAAKIPIEQLGSALATMTLAGISGAESSTSLNQVISKLVKPSKALAALYEQLGYHSGSAALAQKGLRGVMEDIRKATGGQIDQLLVLFPEIRAARGALALMTNEGRNYAKVSGQIEDRDKRRGATLRTLHEQMKAAGNQLTVFKNKMDAALIQGATTALPALIGLMRAAEQGGNAVADAGRRLGEALGPTWRALREIGGDVGNIAGDLKGAFGPLVELLAVLSVGAAVETLNALATVLSVITGFMAENETATATLAAMLGIRLVASALAAAGGLRALATYRLLLPMWYAMSGASDRLATSMQRQALAAKALNVGLTAVAAYALVEAVQSFQKIATAGDDARDSVKGIYDQLGNAPTLDGLRQAQAQISRLQAGVKDPGPGSQFDWATKGLKGAADAKAARAALDEYAAAQRRLSEQSLNMQRNLSQLSQVTGMSQGALQRMAQTAHIDLTGGFVEAYNAVSRYQVQLSRGQDTTSQAKMIKALSDLADSAGDAQKRINGLKDALDALMGAQLGLNEATRNWEQGFHDLAETLAKANGNLDLTTQSGRDNSAALDGQAKALKDLVVAQADAGASGSKLNSTWDTGVARLRATMKAAHFSKAQIDAYTKSLGLVPGGVETVVNAAGADSSAAKVKALRAEIDRLHGKSVNVSVTSETIYKTIGSPPGTRHLGVGMNAHGNIWTESYARGGVRPLPKEAMIARNGPALIQWAEAGTGGEAFIPLASSRRGRSEEILARVAQMFGMRLERYAEGGVTLGQVSDARWDELMRAGWRGRAGDGQEALYSPARQQAYQDWRWGKIADWKEQNRLAAPVALDLSFDLSSAFGATVSRLETLARNAAELKARRTANTHDTADDYYRAPHLTTTRLTADLAAQNRRMRQWRNELGKIAKWAGADVAAQMEAMGERGYAAVHAMATSSAADMRAMATQMRQLTARGQQDATTWGLSLRRQTHETARFQADLMRLIQRGRADIAARLSAMGGEEGGRIAATAAGMSSAQLAGLARDLAANTAASDPALMEALRLAGVLTGTPGLGITGLASKSGMSVADVYTLLTRYRAQVFGNLGTAATQVNRDLQLIAAGKAPSGLYGGGIVSAAGAAAGGLHYRWAESRSKGESLIPHDPGNRDRAMALWRETGQILGAHTGGGSYQVNIRIEAGAVQVNVPVHGSQLTPADVQAAATAAATAANDQLLRRLRQKMGAR